jgi:SAM-dependent methyltransferase
VKPALPHDVLHLPSPRLADELLVTGLGQHVLADRAGQINSHMRVHRARSLVDCPHDGREPRRLPADPAWHDGPMADAADLVRDHYERGEERDRLDTPFGRVELERTREVLGRHLPPPPGVVVDVGGGPGRYAVWLAGRGHRVYHRDLVGLHVEQARSAAAAAGVTLDTRIADARSLDLPDAAADAVLLLGPLYHLPRRADRLRALREACRVARPGAPVSAAAVSRWAPRLHGGVALELHREHPAIASQLETVEERGDLPPLFPGSFSGYCHRPRQLAAEVRAAGLELVDLVGLEGIAFALPDLEARWDDPVSRAVVLDAARALERVPELLGLSPHLLATARRPR